MNFNTTNTSFKGIPCEPSIQALSKLQKTGNKAFIDRFLKYHSALKESNTVDFFIKEENGQIVDAYTKLKKPLKYNAFDTLPAGSEIKACPQVGEHANGTTKLPVIAIKPDGTKVYPDLELGYGSMPERFADDAIGMGGTPYLDNNPAIAFIIDLHHKLGEIFKI